MKCAEVLLNGTLKIKTPEGRAHMPKEVFWDGVAGAQSGWATWLTKSTLGETHCCGARTAAMFDQWTEVYGVLQLVAATKKTVFHMYPHEMESRPGVGYSLSDIQRYWDELRYGSKFHFRKVEGDGYIVVIEVTNMDRFKNSVLAGNFH